MSRSRRARLWRHLKWSDDVSTDLIHNFTLHDVYVIAMYAYRIFKRRLIRINFMPRAVRIINEEICGIIFDFASFMRLCTMSNSIIADPGRASVVRNISFIF